jgi:phage-related protein
MALLKKLTSAFYRTSQGARPVRDFLMELPRGDRRIIGNDIATVEYGWPIGKPTCAPIGLGLWEVRSNLPRNRIARILFTVHEGEMILLHGFVKKTQQTPQDAIDTARTRMKELKK